MSSSLVRRSQSLGLGARNGAARPGLVVRRPQPFAPARRVWVKVASSDEETTDDEEIDALIQGEDFVEGESLDSLVAEDSAVAAIELDDEALAAIAATKDFVATYGDELLVEADMGGDEFSPADGVSSRADAALDRILRHSADSHIDAVAALAGADVAAAEGVEDVQAPHGFGKYDEEVESGISDEQRAQIAQFKLTKTELANLVPEDWDNINIDWFSNRKEENIPLPEYKLNFIWTERNIAVAVDQVYSRGQVSPLTEYFFWPRKDAWEELRMALEARPWISERDKVILLNRTTEVINFWQQEGEKPTLEAVRSKFPDCSFMGTSSPAAPQQMAMSS